MSFLNDTMEYKETYTSLRFSKNKDTTQVTNNFLVTSPSCSSSSTNDINDDVNSENRPPLPPSPAISELSAVTSSSKKRRYSNKTDEIDRALLEALSTHVQPSPIDGFMLRLAEGIYAPTSL
ncbi:PREDICTED: uncharacterized protein LOC105556162 [Vollenhovia emeryi]|uniref:uncharacterized protein LOC105556162 n=1 Tax=Vollenhovia emeryi TaxID=411798 RepID=UPI0005F4F8E0|nr:PREDICTED: uncharacterized protein LOC105556162 [Vollenhovia emeryi]